MKVVPSLTLVALAVIGSAPGLALHLAIRSPQGSAPVFGAVTFEVEVLPVDEVVSVDFFVDGGFVESLDQPPFRTEVELGEENRPHIFEVIATDTRGEIFRAANETTAIAVDLSIDVALQQLYLTVTDREGRRVEDLTAADFRITDRGRPQEIVTFARGDIPFVAVLLVDGSRSMRGPKLEHALAGARAFAAAMRPLDQAKLTVFNDSFRQTTPFTSFPQVLGTGLATARAAGGTSLNDHLYLALKVLEQRQGRRLVILLTDGVVLTSVLDMRQVLWTARRSQSLVFWIRLGVPDPRVTRYSAWRDGDGHRKEMRDLETLVRTTGGSIVTVARSEEITEAFVAILEEIRAQYVLGYYPTEDLDNDRWHSVKVRVRRPDVRARTREGYLDVAPGDYLGPFPGDSP